MTNAIDLNVLNQKLDDLGAFGIHLSNPNGICFVCGKSTRPFSDGMGIDARCESCYRTRGSDDPAYSTKTVWVSKVLSTVYPRAEFNAVVKIDGKLYEVVGTSGTGHLRDLETGEEARSFALHLPSYRLTLWWKDQGDTTTYAYIVQIFWPRVKEKVSSEVHYRAQWAREIPFYDIGHSGRGIEKEGRVCVRLYLEAKTQWNPRDFSLLAVQLVEAPDTPYLENYEVARFPANNAILEWSQAGPMLTAALLGVGHPYILRGYERAKEGLAQAASRHSVPANWWIALFLKRWRDEESHELVDFLLLSKE